MRIISVEKETYAIKYHQNGTGTEYINGKLSNNWDPDQDYGNEYVSVHFRIDAYGYRYPSFQFSERDRKAFDQEVEAVFSSIGWKCNEEYHGSCSTWRNGNSYLYLHPQDFSGKVLKNDIKIIAENLCNRITFDLKWVDLYKTVYDLTDQEYETYLCKKDEKMRKTLFQLCATSRRNRYYPASAIARELSKMFQIDRIGKTLDSAVGSGPVIDHIMKIIDAMILDGYLIQADNAGEKMIRSLNKTEQKQTGKKIS